MTRKPRELQVKGPKRGWRRDQRELAQWGEVTHRCGTCKQQLWRIVLLCDDAWRHIYYEHVIPPKRSHLPVPIPKAGYLS